jgi:hypothetical protein
MLLEHRPKKFVERVARLISSKLVELEVMPKKLDRLLKTWRVEVVICAGIYISLIVGPWPFWRETNFLQASGDPVIAFDPVPYRLALVQAHADLSIAEAQLDRPS